MSLAHAFQPSSSFAKEQISNSYALVFTICAFFTFFATLWIPYCYDQYNLKLYEAADDNHALLIREYGNEILSAYLHAEGVSGTTDTGLIPNRAVELLHDKKLIALDYITQMQAARQLVSNQFIMFSVVLALLLAIALFLVLRLVCNHALRAPLVGGLFVIALYGIQYFGLPHVNHKFHTIIGTVFAVLMAISDFLMTCALPTTEPSDRHEDNGNRGPLTVFENRHHLWTAILGMVVAALLTMTLTVSFVTFDLFRSVFGEAFLVAPLVGLSAAVSIAFLWLIFGILRPIWRNIQLAENSMCRG